MAEKGWTEITPGGLVCDPGSSINYETGSWRTWRPIVDRTLCNCCLRCWAYCPDGSIFVDNGNVTGVDLMHCKGCGICAKECPQKAITMVEEIAARREES